MARIIVVHWNGAPIARVIRELEADGHEVLANSSRPAQAWTDLRAEAVDAVVISMLEKPSWGEQVAESTRSARLSHLPLFFLVSDPAAVRPEVRKAHGGAVFTTLDDLAFQVRRALVGVG